MVRISFPFALRDCPDYWLNYSEQVVSPKENFNERWFNKELSKYGAKLFYKNTNERSEGFWLEFETEAQMLYFKMRWS